MLPADFPMIANTTRKPVNISWLVKPDNLKYSTGIRHDNSHVQDEEGFLITNTFTGFTTNMRERIQSLNSGVKETDGYKISQCIYL